MPKFVIGNLKMNLISSAERESYFESFKKEYAQAKLKEVQVVLCPPVLHLESFVKSLQMEGVLFGLQNCFWEDRGSYTGENSVLAAKNFGATHVLIGHSENRKYRGETDEIINAKLKAVFRNGLVPVLCIGETEEERVGGRTLQVVADQLSKDLKDVGDHLLTRIVIAYEPVWAIGSGKVPTSDEILSVKILIKKVLSRAYSETLAEKIKILYGGSVNSRLVKQVALDPEMDGVLVGRESLIPRELINIAYQMGSK